MMRKLRKVLMLAVIALLLGACSRGHDTAPVVERVNDVYASVFEHYEFALQDSVDGTASPLDALDSMYCTADWNALLARVKYQDSRLGEGVMGFMDADYWVMGQDWQYLALSDVKVTSMTDTTATVELNLHNCGQVIPVRLEMLLEADEWRIDNFIDVKNDFDWKVIMKEYVD
ncbi:MAG: DUF3828 domain-containing protein [Muribaculaceae bacterium]|nr:DUF3828 domain-containing protein [Muribaculaceae bacterium]